ncbi:MAG: hypothetical protein G01um1014107_157 [Parcubacteria group bacterium Gr01-1014_107]|nr:MAG: hypothetical protein G01um1014107_157 [Parcubacteria group bacterium Gr01-1014_107]
MLTVHVMEYQGDAAFIGVVNKKGNGYRRLWRSSAAEKITPDRWQKCGEIDSYDVSDIKRVVKMIQILNRNLKCGLKKVNPRDFIFRLPV